MDDSYPADFLLTYRTFLTSPGQIFDKLMTSWNERTEVHAPVSVYFNLCMFVCLFVCSSLYLLLCSHDLITDNTRSTTLGHQSLW